MIRSTTLNSSSVRPEYALAKATSCSAPSVGASRRPIASIAAWASAASIGPPVPHREGVVGVDAGAPAVAGLRVDQHAVDAQRIDLPLPPRAGGQVVLLPAAGAVARVAVLQHEALDAARARLASQRGERSPVGTQRERRQVQAAGRCVAAGDRMPSQRRLETRPPLALRQRAQVLALPLEEVVGDQADRRVGEHLLGQHLAADALLQEVERRDAAVLPDHDLAVEHGAVGQRLRQRDDLGKALADELLAARPDPDLPGALDHLRADAVVLPLDDPLGRRGEARGEVAFGEVELMGEEERVRLADVERAGVGRTGELREACCAGRRLGVAVAHHPLGDELGVDAGALGERALHEQLADADAKAAADQLVEQEAARRVELVPIRSDPRRLLLGREAAQRQQAVLDPLGQAEVAALRGRRQDQGDGLGEIADGLIAGVEQPVVDAGLAARRRPQHGARDDLARLAAGEEIDRPRRIGAAPLRRSSA